jgi:hypothetical protein
VGVSDRGYRTVDGAWQWTVTTETNEERAYRHFAPDIEKHYYESRGHNEPIPLYHGRFCMPESESDELAYEGDVRLVWLPTPAIEAAGGRGAGRFDFDGWQEWLPDGKDNAWQLIPTLRPLGLSRLPVPPTADATAHALEGFTNQNSGHVYPPELGDGSALTQLTGLLPNGFDVWDGHAIVDPADRRWLRHVRTMAQGGGWELTLDSVNDDIAIWKNLRDKGGYDVTQIVSMRRADGGIFAGADAKNALDAVRYGLALALGRQTEVILPVGWKDETPVWAQWTAGRVDAYRDPGTWLDSSITARQVGEVVGRFLDSWSNDLRRDTLLYSTGYYVQALDRHAEISVASAVSGLLLLGVSWFVEQEGRFTHGEWKSLGMEGQIRTMLESASCRVNTSIPTRFNYLAAATDRLRALAGPQKAHYDGLTCLIKMRNDILHPTSKKRISWSYEEWVEAYLLAVHFLELSILAYIGYRGRYHPRIGTVHAGFVEDVPWLGC